MNIITIVLTWLFPITFSSKYKHSNKHNYNFFTCLFVVFINRNSNKYNYSIFYLFVYSYTKQVI